MTRSIEYLPEAEFEIAHAYRWYEDRRPGLGLEFLRAVDAVVEASRRDPETHEVVTRKTRRALLRRFPYQLFYVAEQERVLVTAIFHGHRDPDRWADRVRDSKAASLVGSALTYR